MADRRVDDLRLQSGILHQLLLPNTMLLRILLEIQIVQQTDHCPEIFLLPVAQLPGKIAHDPFHRASVAQMERILVVLLEQLVCLLDGKCCIHASSILSTSVRSGDRFLHYSHLSPKVQVARPTPVSTDGRADSR